MFKTDKMIIVLSLSFIFSFDLGEGTPFKPKDFCSDSNTIESVFTMGDTTYLMKGKEVYAKRFNERFRDQTPFNPKFVFKNDFESISTGFFVSTIPECKFGLMENFPILSIDKQKKCNELEKLYGMGFIMGYRHKSRGQSYNAFKFREIDAYDAIFRVENNTEMPFGLEIESEILSSELFPFDSNENLIYLHSTYDQKNYSLIHLIKETVTGSLKLVIQSLSVELKNWKHYSIQKVFPSNQLIEHFIGFTQIGVVLRDRKIYAILSTLNSNDGPIVVDFRPDYHLTNNSEQKFFFNQQSIDLIKDIYGCAQSIALTTQKGNTLSLEELEETLPDQKSGETTKKDKKRKRKPKSNSSDSIDAEESETELDDSMSTETIILFLVLISIFTIGFILFVVMIFVVIYIRVRNTKRKEKKTKVKQKKVNE